MMFEMLRLVAVFVDYFDTELSADLPSRLVFGTRFASHTLESINEVFAKFEKNKFTRILRRIKRWSRLIGTIG